MTLNKDSKIILVGAGVFGLSNALHLAKSGYKNVTVFDRLDFGANHYTLLEGADTASADINKIFRAQYAEKKHYQELAFRAFEIWQEWDRKIQLLPESEVKEFTGLRLLDLCGMLRLDDQVGWEELASRDNFAREGLGPLRFDINDKNDLKRAKAQGYGPKVQFALDLQSKIPDLEGVFDSTSGMLYASRCLQYAAYLCKSMGVRFIMGGDKGTFKEYVMISNKIVGGIVTRDGKKHEAELVVINCGPWSTSLVPELDGINEGTGGNILICKIPDSRKDLKVKYSSKNFPIIGWKSGHSREHDYLAGMFIFPVIEPEGILKIIVRQTKYTNPEKLANGRVVSIPKTSNSNPPFEALPRHIVYQVREWLQTFFPDLIDLKWESRILWYTDTINNDYIYDYVPNKKGLFVACGGSGHAFKMLPVLGQFLVDKIEGRENFYTKLFAWRNAKDYEKDPNGLREGLNGARVYKRQLMSSPEDYIFNKMAPHL
ncbi:DEHA2F00374p [Debaryomyces hansenii CBS767]|uniref:DEHA2F00374p n=1 Tax=Debaryomyces hansenii (strain ATCC 36239 / CBS 767 / BCRC 21394 / JCM 1990 / NBRC 0083 / IGC 2968) TaxID=284592 RepID=Q6BN43_DEBHA|nr:DEHA2F00374p [Debaryomyces hansenii CBS767]CAG88679.1 DEHA2F00374p [Debaryomyces hansenii CBS767]|eukprot:XP_460377.1 DEHA2F00374p [Debaryomyces hansenii CBS767]